MGHSQIYRASIIYKKDLENLHKRKHTQRLVINHSMERNGDTQRLVINHSMKTR
jgi:hypothetical protein